MTRAFGPLSTVRYPVNGVDFDMVRVPPGRFVDGEGATRRELLVSRPFELGVAPVTQALWWAVVRGSPSRFHGDDRPVEEVSFWTAPRLSRDQAPAASARRRTRSAAARSSVAMNRCSVFRSLPTRPTFSPWGL